MRRQVKIHAVLALVVAVYAFISFWMNLGQANTIVNSGFGTVFSRFALLIPQMIFMVLLWRLLDLTYVHRATDRVAVIKAEVRTFLTDRDRMLGGVIAAALMTLVLVSFAKLKNLIPTLRPFSWDQTLSDIDRTLHFGSFPHEYLQKVFGSHYVLSFFTGIYNVWLFLMYFSLVIACFLHPDNPIRMRYLLAFILTWAIGGNLLATVFSSAGPAYFANLGLGDTYAPLMDALRAHAATGALSVVGTQDLLWSLYSQPDRMNIISAFPSMHVGSSVLMAIFAFCWHRNAGLVVSIFAGSMMIGSVLLGWHYAVDGYAGALIAVLCWWIAGLILRLPGVSSRPADQG